MLLNIYDIPPLYLGLLSGLFTFAITTLGSSLVFFFKKINNNILSLMLALSSGVMIAASFWSLLTPAIELSNSMYLHSWLIPALGFIFGGAFVYLSDIYLTKILSNNSAKKDTLLFSSITLHNLPEGLAIGVAFGAIRAQSDLALTSSAILLALGIGIQNFPEGLAISIPLFQSGNSKIKSFIFGSISGFIEIIGVVIGFFASYITSLILPFVLSFASGCMIVVACCELLPESASKNKVLTTLGLVIGFVIMMILDVSLS